MSGRLLCLVCSVAVAAAVLTPDPAHAAPAAPAEPAERPVAELLADLQRLYREAERATEAYNATGELLGEKRAAADRLGRRLARARLSLQDSRGEAGRLARQQYQSRTDLSPYVRLLLARDPQRALDQGHVVRQVALERAQAVERLEGSERRTGTLARQARKALDEQLTLAERRREERDAVRESLADVERMLVSLGPERLAELAAFEREETADRQEEFLTSGALGEPRARTPSAAGSEALRYAVEQIGRPYEWGAEGPDAFDCSGLTSRAWEHAGRTVPRTSQEQWKRLERVPLRELRPGDLVVYFPEATHVGVYLGDGLVVHAPRPGGRVKVSPVAANPVLGAVRPDPDGEPLARYTPPELPAGARDGSDEGYTPAVTPAGPAEPVG